MPFKIILFLLLALFPTVLLAEEFNHITIKEIDGDIGWLKPDGQVIFRSWHNPRKKPIGKAGLPGILQGMQKAWIQRIWLWLSP